MCSLLVGKHTTEAAPMEMVKLVTNLVQINLWWINGNVKTCLCVLFVLYVHLICVVL